MTSTTPNYPPPEGLPALLPSSLPNLAPSPFLFSEQFAANFPLPASPLAPSMPVSSTHTHRYTTSTASAPPTLKTEPEEDEAAKDV